MNTIYKHVDTIKYFNGTLNTMELDSVYQSGNWPSHMLSNNYILCDNGGDKYEVSRKIFFDINNHTLNGLNYTANPSHLEAIELAQMYMEAARKQPKTPSGMILDLRTQMRDLSYSSIINIIAKIREGNCVSHNKEKFNGIQWSRNKKLFNFIASYIGDGIWNLKIHFANMDEEYVVLVDDAALIEFILVNDLN